MNDQGDILIDDFLTQIKRKLPEWLKWKEDEVQNILEDLKQQILNEAIFIANGYEPSNADIQQALIQIGTPENIANIYKKRGTPKLYITEELLDFYLRSLFFFWIIVISINIIVSVFQFFFEPWWNVLGSMFTGIWISCLITAVVMTCVFVYFSMEGFLPEDFGVFPKRLALMFPIHFTKRDLEETRQYTKFKLEEAKQRAKERIIKARSLPVEKVSEVKAISEERLAAAKAKRELRKLQPISVGELIFGVAGGIIFGLFLILQPFAEFTELFEELFLDWLIIFGLLIFISGLFNLVRLIAGVRNYTAQQVLIFFEALFSIAYIPLFMYLLNNPEIFPISLFSGGNITEIPSDPDSIAYIIYFWVHIGIIIAIVGGFAGNIYKIYKIQNAKT
ncbi:MAG: hypothetical protein KAT66_03270 [Candidatus Lokiarchaeota archaeon]|nr:hypothetical protein [Candidatus Lokiarchaeota archaeon]